MANARISATWLSDEMAHALAAMWPPLAAADVMRAADELTASAARSPVLHLVRNGDSGAAIEPGVFEALRALRDMGR